MLDKVTFIGSKHIGLTALKTIYSLAPDKLHSIITINDTADVRCELNNFKDFSKTTGKTLFILNKPSELESVIQDDPPDMCLVVGWYWLFKKDLLDKIPNGLLGIHASLLPKNRGGAPLVWPIINGDKESGISLFYIDEGMDTGDIVGQKRFNIKNEDTVADIIVKAASLTIELLKDKYYLLLDGTAPRVPQNHNAATYCSQRKPEDGHINWRSTNVEIHNAIRAQSHPYPGAFSFVDGKKLYIWKSMVFKQVYYGIPGLVVEVTNNYVIVTCGKGAICLYEAQFEGFPKESANKVLKYEDRLK